MYNYLLKIKILIGLNLFFVDDYDLMSFLLFGLVEYLYC